jgi:LuxR family maltose regulon positive regulatory protein
VRDSSLPVGWVSLEQDDDDLVRFLTYLVATLQRVLGADFGAAILAGFESAQHPPIELTLSILINEAAAVPDDFVLILDDYHVVEQPSVHQALTFLLEHLPPQMHLVIASRSDPPLPLARLRVRGELAEIRDSDLRFTPEETVVFLKKVMGLDLSPPDIAALERRTEGWIAGLQIAALSMQGRQDVSGFVKAFAGDNRYILDYLTEEVLYRQPEDVQSFLLRTSILDRLSGALCNAITGQSDGQTKLESLDRANLFLIPIDDKRHWFRYHHLFADFLRDRLNREQDGAQVSSLHLLASEWYEANGLLEEALRHALSGKNYERAARLVEQTADKVTFTSPNKVLRWLEALPKDVVQSRPKLSAWKALALISLGQLDEAEPYLEDAERGAGIMASDLTTRKGEQQVHVLETASVEAAAEETFRSQDYSGQLIATRAILACYRGDASYAVDLSHRALTFIPQDDYYWRSLMAVNIALNLAGVTRSSREMAEASRLVAEAGKVSLAAGDTYTALFSFSKLAEFCKIQGQLHRAAEFFQQAMDLSIGQGRRQFLPAVSKAKVGLGIVLYEWNDLDSAAGHLLTGIELAEQGGDLDALGDGYIALARTRHALGDLAGASEMLQKAKHFAQESDVAWVEARAAVGQIRLWLSEGNVAAAVHWARNSGLNIGDDIGYHREDQHTTLARAYIAGGETDLALDLLKWLSTVSEQAGLAGVFIESRMLEALALQAKGQLEAALDVLQKTLVLAEPESYVRLFVDEGTPMQSLLQHSSSFGVSPNYTYALLEAFGDQGAATVPALIQPLVEPLSDRELQVLRLVAAGLSSREIGDELIISTNTVNSHLKNIYGKLGAHSRVQAVEIARDLQLLSA